MFTTSVAKKEKQQMDEIYSRRPHLVDLLAAAACQSVSCLSVSIHKCYASNLQNNPLLQEIEKPGAERKQTRTAKPFAVYVKLMKP
jgi:hypothetical protein